MSEKDTRLLINVWSAMTGIIVCMTALILLGWSV